ncbi:MAG: low specificity L-threonine aldolase [Rhizobiaceae bacterium]
MHFASDNWAGVHQKIAESLTRHSSGFAPAYGASDFDKAVEKKFSDIFECGVSVYFVATGTAANALSIAAFNRPGGITFCHENAHVAEDECGAVEYLTGGSRLALIPGANGKMELSALEKAIARNPAAFIHGGQPMGITLTQVTEAGTVHSLDEIRAVSAIAKANALPLHMDGARFANALVALGCTPAQMTWQSGVDILSFGGTKNGCWCAEAIVVFNKDLDAQMPFLRKRGAQLFSKSRFIAAQFDAYFADDLWLESARHANGMAKQLADGLAASGRARLHSDPQANEVFAILANADIERLRAAGAVFYDWHAPSDGSVRHDETMIRCVTSFATSVTSVKQLLSILS